MFPKGIGGAHKLATPTEKIIRNECEKLDLKLTMSFRVKINIVKKAVELANQFNGVCKVGSGRVRVETTFLILRGCICPAMGRIL